MKLITGMVAGAAGAAVAVWLWIVYQEQKTNPQPAADPEED
jgi:hypothetical protein